MMTCMDTYYKAVDKFVRVYYDLGLIELSSVNKINLV